MNAGLKILAVGQRHSVGPEHVMLFGAETSQEIDDLCWTKDTYSSRGIAQHAHEAILRDGACRPTMRADGRQTSRARSHGACVWDCGAPTTHSHRAARRGSLFVSELIDQLHRHDALARAMGQKGTPLRTFGTGPVGVSALRARSDTTLPAVTPPKTRQFFRRLQGRPHRDRASFSCRSSSRITHQMSMAA